VLELLHRVSEGETGLRRRLWLRCISDLWWWVADVALLMLFLVDRGDSEVALLYKDLGVPNLPGPTQMMIRDSRLGLIVCNIFGEWPAFDC